MEQNFVSKIELINSIRNERVFLVCGKSFLEKELYKELCCSVKEIYTYTDFTPNPELTSVKNGVKKFKEFSGSYLLAVGGGSAIDVAKGIKAFLHCKNDEEIELLIPKENNITLAAVPTTAGSGSESTHFSVIYRNGRKLSLAERYLLPSAVLLDATLLSSLSEYQRKSTFLDALAHSIESFWAVKSNEESREIAEKALRFCIKHKERYVANSNQGNEGMLQASNYAGQAINLTTTTAGHAMSYKLTTLYGISHGHAVFLCMRELWPWMWEKAKENDHINLLKTMNRIAEIMGCGSGEDVTLFMETLLAELDLNYPQISENDIDVLVNEVNIQRLSNHPLVIDKDDLRRFYTNIMKRQS